MPPPASKIPRGISLLWPIALAGVVLYTTDTEILRPGAPSHTPEHRVPLIILKTIVFTVLIGGAGALLGAALFALSGVYNIAADTPHLPPTRWTLLTVRTRSVQFHAKDIKAPNLHQPSMLP